MAKRNGLAVVQAPDDTWQLGMGYDYRFAMVGMSLHRGAEEVRFNIPLSELFKHLNIGRHELEAVLLKEYEPTEGLEDIEKARVRLLESVDWRGKTVLDIGGYDGFAAEIAHKGGAARAICLDNHQYEHYGWKDVKKEGVEYINSDVMRWCLPKGGIYDIIINYNVLYHVKNPWAFLDKCREIIKPDGEMLLCSLFRYHEGPWMYVYEPRECNPTDDTVYFGPSLGALERLLKATGWDAERYALAYDRVLYRCKPTAAWERKHEDT